MEPRWMAWGAMATALLAGLPAQAGPQGCTVRSGPLRNPLVELYTSEGCSSCPPADRWLSALTPAPAQPSLVPIAFHVSYWDDLGWKDAFASKRYTDRQRELAAAAGRANVYTPQVMLGGHDYPAWNGSQATAALQAIARTPAKATLEIAQLTEASEVSARVKVTLPANQPAAGLVLVVALTEDNLGSRVTAGENRGATLRHDHVARDYATYPVQSGHEVLAHFAVKPAPKAADAHVVAFVQDRRTGEVLQALSACTTPST